MYLYKFIHMWICSHLHISKYVHVFIFWTTMRPPKDEKLPADGIANSRGCLGKFCAAATRIRHSKVLVSPT